MPAIVSIDVFVKTSVVLTPATPSSLPGVRKAVSSTRDTLANLLEAHATSVRKNRYLSALQHDFGVHVASLYGLTIADSGDG